MKKLRLKVFFKVCAVIFYFLFFNNSLSYSSNNIDFDNWLIDFKKSALKKGISKETINSSLNNVKYLAQVIKYDRKDCSHLLGHCRITY